MAQSKTPEPALPAGSHRDGCVAERIEARSVTRVEDGARLTVTRCIDCGGQVEVEVDPRGDHHA